MFAAFLAVGNRRVCCFMHGKLKSDGGCVIRGNMQGIWRGSLLSRKTLFYLTNTAGPKRALAEGAKKKTAL